MTSDDESDRIQALLREAHRGDEPCPPFQKLVRGLRSGRRAPRSAWALRAAALAAVAAAASAVAVLSLRGERRPSSSSPGAGAWSSGVPESPLDFLLALPRAPSLEALPSLRELPQTHRR